MTLKPDLVLVQWFHEGQFYEEFLNPGQILWP